MCGLTTTALVQSARMIREIDSIHLSITLRIAKVSQWKKCASPVRRAPLKFGSKARAGGTRGGHPGPLSYTARGDVHVNHEANASRFCCNVDRDKCDTSRRLAGEGEARRIRQDLLSLWRGLLLH